MGTYTAETKRPEEIDSEKVQFRTGTAKQTEALCDFLRRAPKECKTAHGLIAFVDKQHPLLLASYAKAGEAAGEASIPLDPPTKDELLQMLISDELKPAWQQIQNDARSFSEKATGGAKPLPDFESALELGVSLAGTDEPAQLVQGMLHVGEKLMFSGDSKSGKSWGSLDLAVSVSSGRDFWGMRTTKGRVLLVNFEIPRWFLNKRINAVAESKGCLSDLNNLSTWNLRGFRSNFDRIRTELMNRLSVARSEGEPYALIVFDPLYSMLQGRQENSNEDMADLMADMEEIAEDSGAAVAMIHHFAKGNSSARSGIDRASGAGVLARDPDCIVTLNMHQDGAARVAEFTLRNFPALPPIGLRREHPLFVLDNGLDTRKLEGRNNGNESFATLPEFVALAYELGNEGDEISSKALRELAAERFGYSKAENGALYDFVRDAKKAGRLAEAGRGLLRIPRNES